MSESKRNIDCLDQNLNTIVNNTKKFEQNKESGKKHDGSWTITKHHQNNTRFLNIKRHNAAINCHILTKKCHAMTSSGCRNIQKTQGQSVGYVKVRFFALPLILVQMKVSSSNYRTEYRLSFCTLIIWI